MSNQFKAFIRRYLYEESSTNRQVSWPSSWPAFCAIWPWKRPVSGWRWFWASSSFVRWLVLNAFRESSGVVSEWPCSSGFIRKSSRRDNASRMWFSVLLNSFDNLFVTLPSISSEILVMHSSCDLGVVAFCAELLLGGSSQFSLFNAANLLLFRVVIFYGKNNDHSVILDYSFCWTRNQFYF